MNVSYNKKKSLLLGSFKEKQKKGRKKTDAYTMRQINYGCFLNTTVLPVRHNFL